ncbi:hypothetical protein THRCLA_00281 [Thraustotheca clavata]|uniref:EamA domain-containing protein n=1 Tax=Thraustotheca clavata TaxID=74557 RepID=A0A1W0ABQ8_9STRA|nr:hypothetical protein THRCLA_00281 [Thraustotheca clavata]
MRLTTEQNNQCHDILELNYCYHPGLLYAFSATLIWGLYPLYWKQLDSVSGMQLAMHRIAWSFVILAVIVTIKREWIEFGKSILSWKIFGIYTISSALIFCTWYLLVWAINEGYITQASLGMFITPLLNVLFGVVFFKEKLNRWQWLSVIFAVAGVVVCAIAYGKFPWVSFTMATAFALYSLVKKQAPLNPLHGMTLETLILFPIALIYLIVVNCQGSGAFGHHGTGMDLLLIGGGLVTMLPLLLFSAAAQLIELSLLGIIQYIQPTLQFFIGVFVYDEPLSMSKLAGFILVWIGLAIYTIDGVKFHKGSSAESSTIEDDKELSDVSYIEKV